MKMKRVASLPPFSSNYPPVLTFMQINRTHPAAAYSHTATASVKIPNFNNIVFPFKCLLITAVLYLLVPELKDLHGKSLACHSFSLATGFFLLAFTQFRDMNTFEGKFGMKSMLLR